MRSTSRLQKKLVVSSSATAPKYNMAADVLCLAFACHKEGDIERSLVLAHEAFKSTAQMSELVRAFESLNAKAETAIDSTSEGPDDEDYMGGKDAAGEDEEYDGPDFDVDDEEGEMEQVHVINSSTDSDEVDEIIAALAERSAEEAESDYDEDEQPSAMARKMKKQTASSKSGKEMRIIANKLSLLGKNRELAKELLDL